jgi:transposase
MGRKWSQVSGKIFTEQDKRKIIEEYLLAGCTKREIWKKYTGQQEENGHLLNWMRELGYEDEKRVNTFISNRELMSKKKEVLSDQEIENLQLQKRISELERQLKDAELKAIAFSTMVDIAEREFKIPIRKKLNTKP